MFSSEYKMEKGPEQGGFCYSSHK